MAPVTISVESVVNEQLRILCDEKNVHAHLQISADELCHQAQKIKIFSPNISPFDPIPVPQLNFAVIGPWFDFDNPSQILHCAGVDGRIEGEGYNDSDPFWHILEFNTGDQLRGLKTDDCAKTLGVAGFRSLSLRQGLYLSILGFKPEIPPDFDTVGLSLAATVLRFPRLAVLYFRRDGSKTLGDHWPSYREPFLQMPFGRIAFA